MASKTRRKTAAILGPSTHKAGAVMGVLAILAALGACDMRRSESDPLEECMAYARTAEPCFGERAAARLRASFTIPPRDESARAALRARCIDQRARISRVCR